ncbi:hypothetical protein IFM89_025750 [Coptis chinensis]|uniref:Dof zinc finger protein n=1 Tax=Coptis chinensis TaxID=261450 RepID=A0A835H0K6_9MAGN|nr:hypothetical protein IFM89_025750 [Coptis chinensis]
MALLSTYFTSSYGLYFLPHFIEQKKDEDGVMTSSSGRTMGMKQPQDQQVLKCPRCDSSNTKFCYYNNYNLSQPRHFCKACKRYWTRGGTLRNVPIGGGCRKNKRIKRYSASDLSPKFPTTKSSTSQNGFISAGNDVNPVFYGLQLNNQSEINFTFPKFNSRVLNQITSCTGFDTESQLLSAYGTGFPSMGMTSIGEHGEHSTQTHDVVTSAPSIPNYPVFGSSANTASMITSSIHQQKSFISSGLKDTRPSNNFQAVFPFNDLLLGSLGTDRTTFTKAEKMEEGNGVMSNKVDFNAPSIERMDSLGSSVYWNSVGAWPDFCNF